VRADGRSGPSQRISCTQTQSVSLQIMCVCERVSASPRHSADMQSSTLPMGLDEGDGLSWREKDEAAFVTESSRDHETSGAKPAFDVIHAAACSPSQYK
jgi:hypothetical protein